MTVSPTRARRRTTWLGSQPLPPVTSVVTDRAPLLCRCMRRRSYTASGRTDVILAQPESEFQEDRVTSTAETAKAWGGRFSQAPDRRLEAYNASVDFDVRLVREDIRGSIAHVRMLGQQGIISRDEATALEQGLWRVLSEVDAGEFALTLADEDVHTG